MNRLQKDGIAQILDGVVLTGILSTASYATDHLTLSLFEISGVIVSSISAFIAALFLRKD